MRRLILLLVALSAMVPAASALEGRRGDSVLLNGDWQFFLGGVDEDVDAAGRDWRPVTLPGRFVPWSEGVPESIPFVWTRRTFQVSETQAARLAVLRWNRIAHGAAAFLNGHEIGRHEPTGPCQMLVPPGVLRAGENEIVLRIAGGAGVRKSQSGHFLFPVGQIWGPSKPENAGVTQDVWIDFADRVYIKWVLALPDLAGSRVKIRVTPTGLEPLDDLHISASVRPWPNGDVVGTGQAVAHLKPDSDPLGGKHFLVDVPLSQFREWSPEDCNLYTAEVAIRQGDRVLDQATIRFGMRELTVVDGDYRMNGKTLRIRGSNLVHEWDWEGVLDGKELDYLVTEARELNTAAFRTHTQPPPADWTDICDEHGTMILSEFPVLYNYRDPKFTPEEWEIFHRNAILDTAGWMSRLWNHPSVVMWVLSNESRMDNEWESGPFRDFVVGLDPTRPTMRTGTTGTKTNYDVHTCGNTNHWTHEGQLQTQIDGWFRQAAGRTVTNSEYMNIFDRPLCQWTGTDDELADRIAYAQLGMEHTEAMRRARLDAILPYMYAKWSKTRRGEVWKAGYCVPVSACWHSSLSPVLASLDLFDANYLTGQQVTTDLYLINDSWHDAEIHVELLLTQECPEFIPEAVCFDSPLAKWEFDFALSADSLRRVPVTWKLPDREGCYWLTARTTDIAGRPVLSQRFVRAVRPPEIPAVLKAKTLVIFGADEDSRQYFRSKQLAMGSYRRQTVGDAGTRKEPVTDDHALASVATLDHRDDHEQLSPDKHVVVVWNPARLTDRERRSAAALKRFADEGGRVIVLATDRWDWKDLCDVNIGRTGGSRVFPYPDSHQRFLGGLDPECLQRWNGLPGTVAAGSIEGPAADRGKPLLWVREPKHTVLAEIGTGDGEGGMLFSTLDLRRHVISGSSHYDPVADRLLLNILIDPPL